MKTLIKNGTIVTSRSVLKTDILIDDGKIVEISTKIKTKDIDQTIDAKRRYVLPGGIDPHVHMQLSTPAGISSDDFESGSIAAMHGGTTTMIDFVTPEKGESLIDALEKRKKEAKKSKINCSFHISPIEWTKNTKSEIQKCIQLGYKSFKVYMAYKDSIGLDDKDILKVMQAVGEHGGVVTVHCEIDEEINELRDKLFEDGKTNPMAHPLSRPAITEFEAVKKVIELSKKANCPVYIVHVSTKESIEYIENQRRRGEDVFAETCPQYLLLDDSRYEGPFNETSKFVMSPPLRTQSDNVALWKAIDRNAIQTIGTDHCPFTQKQKNAGKDDFRKIPNGAGGIEHRLALLFTYGFKRQLISINKLADVLSTQAAKIFGMYPQKGEIAVGSDADLVIYNPLGISEISKDTHNQNSDLNIYERFKVEGKPEYVILGGEVVVENK